LRTYTLTFVCASLIIAASLYSAAAYESMPASLRHGTVEVASILTSTGSGTASFAECPLHIPLVLVVLSFIGGCAGSTAGGLKVLPIILLSKIGTALALTIAMMAAGLDLETAFGAVVATINLLGPELGDIAGNFVSVSPYVQWLSVFGMLVGRLEVFTLLILFCPGYWRN